MGGSGIGVAAVGLVAAILSGMAWGVVNGVLVAMAKVPAADRHPRHAVGCAGTRAGAHRRHRHPLGPQRADRLQRLHKGIGHPRPAVRRAGGCRSRRNPAAQDQVRPLHVCHRQQRGGRPSYRRQSDAASGARVRAGGNPGRTRRAALARSVRHHDDRRAVVDQPQRHRRGGHRRHVHLRRRSARSSAPSSACSSPPCCSPASSSSASNPSGRASRSARCSSPPSTSTKPGAPRPCAVRGPEASSIAEGRNERKASEP